MTEVFDNIIKSLNYKQLKSSFLINQAAELPYCKRNILRAKILFWDFIYSELAQRLILNVKGAHRSLNINNKCSEYLINNKLANPKVVDFFFAMHEPLTRAFLQVIQKELDNGHSLERKIEIIEEELLELLNIALIELNGLDVDCTAFGCTPICPRFQETGVSDCAARGVNNIVTVFVNPEYFLSDDILPGILASIKKLKNAKDIILLIDYRNMCLRMQTYDWESNGAYERYLICKQYVREIYFYKTNPCVSFGKYKDELNKYILKSEKDKKELIKNWRQGKLIYFD